MAYFHYNASAYPIRADLGGAYQHYWQQLASPGSWFTGLQRVAIAAEVRHALSCPFCKERKGALSPYNFLGQHTCGDTLDERLVDAVHRIITDQSRITQAYIDNNTASGFSEEQYVELVGIAVTVFSIDEFNRALGLSQQTIVRNWPHAAPGLCRCCPLKPPLGKNRICGLRPNPPMYCVL